MLKCRACGFPTVLNRLIRWDDNGTIVHRLRPDFRIMLQEADLLSKLITSIEDELDLPVREMAAAVARDASRTVIDADLSGLNRPARWRPFKRFTVRNLDRMAVWCGLCYSRTTRYVPGVSSEGVIRNPFNRELMAAFITGALESLEGKPYRYEWRKSGGDDFMRVEVDPGPRPPVDPLPLHIPLKPGRRHLERCSRCGAPLAMRDLKWIEREGVIMDIRKGVRMAFLDFYSADVVVDKLARELGPSFTPIVVDTQRAFFLRHIWEEFLSKHRGEKALPKDELYRQVLDTLALRGQGNPVRHALDGEKFSVTIENPFNEFLLAGFLSALYECSEGKVPEVKWERPDDQTLSFTLEPAAS